MKELEHLEQVALFRWAKYQERAIPELEMLIAMPNGGKRHIRVAQKLKAEGAKSGYPDILFDVSRGGYLTLRIEMKKRDGGTVSENQEKWGKRLTKHGHLWRVCNGWDEARELILSYLSGKEIKN